MKIKTLNLPIMINIVSILLVLFIFLFPSYYLRIILGLPFMMFLPGYALLSALFVRREGRDVVEIIALSIGLSIAVCGLIGLGLNFTVWGIGLEPVLYSVAVFTLIASVIASIRGALSSRPEKIVSEHYLKMPSWQIGGVGKSVLIILVVAIVGSLGALGYVVSTSRAGEAFTGLYMLGLEGKAQNYPDEFIFQNGRVAYVRYTSDAPEVAGEWGLVTLGILNREQQTEIYSIKATIDQVPVSIYFGGTAVDQITGIELQPGGKWEQAVGFAPQRPGDRQNVEFILYKGGEPVDRLNLWVNAR